MVDVFLRWAMSAVGSANLLLGSESETIEVHTTYVGDGLGSLLQCAVDLRMGSRSTFALLPAEPGGTVLFFGGADVDVYLQVVEFRDMQTLEHRWSGGVLRWHGRVSVESFLREAVLMGEDVLRRHGGAAGYAKAWGGIEFPTKQLELLRGS